MAWTIPSEAWWQTSEREEEVYRAAARPRRADPWAAVVDEDRLEPEDEDLLAALASREPEDEEDGEPLNFIAGAGRSLGPPTNSLISPV